MRIQGPFIGRHVIPTFWIALWVTVATGTAYADRLEVSIDDGQTWSYQSTVRFTIQFQDSSSPRVTFLMTYNGIYLVRSTAQPGGGPGAIALIALDLPGNASGYVHVEVTQASSVGTINLVAGAPTDVYTSVLNMNITGNLGSVYVKQVDGVGGLVVLEKSDWTAGVGGNVTGTISCRVPAIHVAGDLAQGAQVTVTDEAVSGAILFDGDIDGQVTVGSAYAGFSICGSNLSTVRCKAELPDNIQITPAEEHWKICGWDWPAQRDAVIYVKQNATGADNGTSWTDAFTGLPSALACAASGQDIWVAAGTYKPAPQGSARTYTFLLRNGIDVYGGFAGNEDPATFDLATRDFVTNETTLSGDLAGDDGTSFTNRSDNAYHVVGATSASGTATLDGFTVRGGQADGSGATEANTGAGVYITGSAPTVVNCTITDNLAVYSGGGVAFHADSGAALTNSVVGGNVAQYGGGVDFVSSHAVLHGSWIAGNSALAFTAPSYGGGVFCDAESEIPILENCAIAGNWSDNDGGGLYAQGQGITVRSSLIVANTSYRHGGGGYWAMNGSDGAGEVTNCTFNNNLAGGVGGAVCKVASQTLTLRNSILWGDLAGSNPEIYNDAGLIIVSYCDVSGGYADTGNISQDPAFVDADGADNDPDTWQDNDYHLAGNSPCIDKGNSQFVTPGETDIDGDERKEYQQVDMGADEYICLSPADFDNDYDVDLADFGIFQDCFNGPNRAPEHAGCEPGDFDHDSDVDLADFLNGFQASFNGPNRPPKGGCLPRASLGDGGFASRDDEGRDSLDSFEVTFDLQSPQAGQTIAAGDPVEWHAFVTVTGDNQGLAGYMLNLFLGPDTGPEPGPDGIWGTADDANLADIVIDQAIEAESFAVAGANGKPTVGAPASFSGSHGGPGMNAMTSYGYNAMPGTLLQVANAHLDWNPWRYATLPPPPGWRGTHTWGIGLDSRKETLLLNTTGDYELNAGWIDTTNLAPGHYVLTLVPDSRAKVLDPAVDLSVAQPGGLVLPANSVSGPVSIEFDIEE